MTPPKKLMPAYLLALIDVLLTGVALCVFALFHHVLPQALKGDNIEINRPSTAASAAAEPSVQNSVSSSAVDDLQPTVGSFYEKFAGRFCDTIVSTGSSYTSSNLSIAVSKEVLGSGSSTITYYLADVYIADISQFRTGFAGGTYAKGVRDSLTDMDAFYHALLSIAGDYYGNHDDGIVIRNGVVYRSIVTQEDVCVLYYDGTMETISPGDFDIDEVVAKGAWQAWTFGPMLLKEGQQTATFNTSSYLMRSHPRTAIGYYEPGHYCFVNRWPGYGIFQWHDA